MADMALLASAAAAVALARRLASRSRRRIAVTASNRSHLRNLARLARDRCGRRARVDENVESLELTVIANGKRIEALAREIAALGLQVR